MHKVGCSWLKCSVADAIRVAGSLVPVLQSWPFKPMTDQQGLWDNQAHCPLCPGNTKVGGALGMGGGEQVPIGPDCQGWRDELSRCQGGWKCDLTLSLNPWSTQPFGPAVFSQQSFSSHSTPPSHRSATDCSSSSHCGCSFKSSVLYFSSCSIIMTISFMFPVFKAPFLLLKWISCLSFARPRLICIFHHNWGSHFDSFWTQGVPLYPQVPCALYSPVNYKTVSVAFTHTLTLMSQDWWTHAGMLDVSDVMWFAQVLNRGWWWSNSLSWCCKKGWPVCLSSCFRWRGAGNIPVLHL